MEEPYFLNVFFERNGFAEMDGGKSAGRFFCRPFLGK